ncbi:MAG: hypothetical protein JNK11_08865 [Alphaproteobacteria bacterium]|nr:hypothetical protein [Alphaproteobacteria bacterium]
MLTVGLIDIEASSLHPDRSYPIEVGWGVIGERAPTSCLVCPEPEWIDWDPASQEVHKIRRVTLLEQGLPPREVCARLLHDVAKVPLFSDAHEVDHIWLWRLFEAGGVASLCPRVGCLRTMLARTCGLDPDEWDEARRRASLAAPRTHRAAGDVAHMIALCDAACAIARERG